MAWDYVAMGPGRIIVLALGSLVAAAAVEAQIGSTKYELNGAVYSVPYKYEFARNFRLPWIDGLQGLDNEAEESLWLLIPASELARDVPGYNRLFHGYSTDVEADMIVHVLGGIEASEFPQDRTEKMRLVTEALEFGYGQELDQATGWQRTYSLRGKKGTPGEGHSIFYLMPSEGTGNLPTNWQPPSCQSSPDINGRERFDCSYRIYQDGLTFDFDLRQVNLGTVNRIPDYVLARLNEWRD